MSENMLQHIDPTRVVLGLASGDQRIKDQASASPGTALAVLGSVHTQGEIKLPVLARALDEALALISDVDEARELLDAHLRPQAQAELIGAHSDKLSVVVQIAGPEVVLAALEEDAEDAGDLARIALQLRAWAQNLKDREDWEEILDMEVGDNTPVRHLLLMALLGEVEEIDDLTSDIFLGVGLDPDSDLELLQELKQDGRLPNFRHLDVSTARHRLREKRKTFELDTSSEALQAVVDELDNLI